MITRIAVELFLGLAAVCTLVPLAWRQVLRARREIAEISADEARNLRRVDYVEVDASARLPDGGRPQASLGTGDDKPGSTAPDEQP